MGAKRYMFSFFLEMFQISRPQGHERLLRLLSWHSSKSLDPSPKIARNSRIPRTPYGVAGSLKWNVCGEFKVLRPVHPLEALETRVKCQETSFRDAH